MNFKPHVKPETLNLQLKTIKKWERLKGLPLIISGEESQGLNYEGEG